MPTVTLLVAESVKEDRVYALDPQFAEGNANATREIAEALIFQTEDEAREFCVNSPVPFVPIEITFEFDYFQ